MEQDSAHVPTFLCVLEGRQEHGWVAIRKRGRHGVVGVPHSEEFSARYNTTPVNYSYLVSYFPRLGIRHAAPTDPGLFGCLFPEIGPPGSLMTSFDHREPGIHLERAAAVKRRNNRKARAKCKTIVNLDAMPP